MSAILIPVAGSEEAVEVAVSELAEMDPNDVIDILQAEMASLDLWLRFAVEYYKLGRTDAFNTLLQPLVDLHNQPSSTVGVPNMLHEQFGNDKAVKKQFLEILNALAAFHAVSGARSRDKATRKTEFEQAKKYYDSAESVDLLSSSMYVGQAMLLVAKGESARAEKMLENVADLSRDNVPALLGKACAKFNAGETKEALKLYRAVFEINPSPPPTVRLGLAYCYARLGQPQLAQKALLRTLELHDGCVEAMGGLAALYLNEDRVSEALGLLKRAYQLEPDNPAVLNHLATHHFYKQQYDKAHKLANRAFLNSASAAVRSESCYHIARCFHAKSDYASALQWYSQSFKENPAYMAPQFGLGQMHLVNNDTPRAIECFEKVLKASPDNVDALKVLGSLYSSTDRRALALERLTKATELSPHDVDAWLEMARVQEDNLESLPQALKAYETAASLLKQSKQRLPAELWNNLGALRHRLGKLDSAEHAYLHALKVSSAAGFENEFDDSNITSTFNLACLRQERGEIALAEAKFKGILTAHPNYTDCYLRLSSCAAARGSPQEAIAWLKRCIDLDPLNPDTWSMLGNVYMGERDYTQAHACFDKVLSKCEPQEVCKRDCYATAQLATVQLKMASEANTTRHKEAQAQKDAADKKASQLDKATEMFKAVLGHEPSNLYAAHGIGVVCVQKGRLQEAREIFTQVREASADAAGAMLNLAQLHALQGEHAVAVPLYQKVAKRAGAARSVGTLMLEARSLFDSNKLPEAKRVLCKALHLRPSALSAWHNLALAHERSARNPTKGPRPVETVQQAVADLAFARHLCSAITSLSAAAEAAIAAEAGRKQSEAPVEKLSRSRIGDTAKRCASLGETLEAELEEATRRRDAETLLLQQAAAKEAELKAERDAKAATEEAARVAAEEAAAEIFRKQKERLAEKLEQWRDEDAKQAEEAAAKGREKKRKKGDAPAADDESEEEYDPNAPEGGAGGADDADAAGGGADEEEAAEEDLFGSDESDAEGGGGKKAAGGGGGGGGDVDEDALFGSDADDEGGGAKLTFAPDKKKKKKLKASRVLQDDDEPILDLEEDDAPARAPTLAPDGGGGGGGGGSGGGNCGGGTSEDKADEKSPGGKRRRRRRRKKRSASSSDDDESSSESESGGRRKRRRKRRSDSSDESESSDSGERRKKRKKHR